MVKNSFVIVSDSILLTSLQFSFGYNQAAFVSAKRGGLGAIPGT